MKALMKLKRKHPMGYMHFGRHTITTEEQELELNEAEIKDLENDGPKHWFSIKKSEEAKKPAEDKPKKKASKKKASKKKAK